MSRARHTSASRISSNSATATSGSRRNAATTGSSARQSRHPSDAKIASVSPPAAECPGLAGIETREPSGGPSSAMSSADSVRSRRRRTPTSRASASTATARTTMHANENARPITTHPSLPGAAVGMLGAATNAAASPRLRKIAASPTRDPAPKHPHGCPLRPRRISTASRTANAARRPPATYAAPSMPAATPTANAASVVMSRRVAGTRSGSATP